MVGKAYFLFGDVQFFEVINDFLFEAVLVDIFNLCPFVDFFLQALADGDDALPFELGYLGCQFFNQAHAAEDVLHQRLALLEAEAVDFLQRLFNACPEGKPFLFVQFLYFHLQGFREAHDGLQQSVAVRLNAQLPGNFLQLAVILHDYGAIDCYVFVGVCIVEINIHVHFAPVQAFFDQSTDVHFLFPVERGQAEAHVQLFGI